MLLSVVVPAYNARDTLLRCLRSVADQDVGPGDCEIVVVDDGSTDDTRRIAEEFAATRPGTIVHAQENAGVSAARNAGIRQSQGRFLYFVDSDDYVASGVLGGLARIMEDAGLDALGFGFLTREVEDPALPLPLATEAGEIVVTTGRQYAAATHYRNAIGWYMVSRELLARSGIEFEVGRQLEDMIFTTEVLSAARRFAYVPVDVYRYVHRPGSILRSTDSASTARLIADYEHAVGRLDEIRRRAMAEPDAAAAFVDRLSYRETSVVFFLLGRLLRSEVPVWPALPATIGRLRAIGRYPMTGFPGGDYRGIAYRLLTPVLNHPYLLYPVALLYRGTRAIRRAVSAAGRAGRARAGA